MPFEMVMVISASFIRSSIVESPSKLNQRRGIISFR
jgi:hypothetical protein